MLFTAVKRVGTATQAGNLDELVVHIGRLLRHPAYRRDRVVSPMLLRHLPADAGYAWKGEATLRGRLAGAGLDATRLDHLIANARDELARLRSPGGA